MLKAKLNKEQYDELSDDIKAEYKESGDGYVVQVEGMKTQADIDSVQEALRKEREDHKAVQAKVKELEKETGSLNDKIKVYESDESKKLSAADRVEMERLKRENESLTKAKTDIEGKYGTLEKEVTVSKIKSELTMAAKGLIRDEAINDTVDILCNKFVVSDGKVLTNTELGDKSGLEAKAYLSHYAEGRSYLTPQSSGGGAGGGGGSGGGSQTMPAQTGVTVSQELWGDKAAG